ncbi:putrescine oxidase protein [Candidatus Micropelagos thuwalensis]|uniref:Flagellar M-ring protein n=1 Tax=Candidatus Micropelagius thuwalensis TaxID=1397666 RepID=U2W9F0_9PROT|nr:flagellar basal-body MS-ring/collar protein FliF [Candidatus Micropelagos thuwalensis]ERL46209.1 putrescine oxidase protein [Candidatus Micropelagos thuwalensis]
MSETTITSVQTNVDSSQGQVKQLLAKAQNFFNEPSVQRSLPTLMAVIVCFVGLMAYLMLQKPARTTLYSSLPEAEKMRVVEALKNAGVDVILDPTTGEVLVPTSDYHNSRIMLAAQGLPASVPEGYSGLNDMPMGTSRSVESMHIKQAQELELARSISEIDTVLAARVHLALPEKSVFVRSNPDPTASVFLQLANGRSLGRTQVEAIIHLVSSSVPGLNKENVTVIDQNGALLSRTADDPDSILSDSQLEYKMRLEGIYRNRVVSILTPIVGAGNVNAQINIDFDFTRIDRTEEIVDPNGNALRSEQKTLDQTADLTAKGIPGAVTNTPPTKAELEIEEGQGPDGAGGQLQTRSSSEVRNFEVSRTVSTTQSPRVQIDRLFASVLVSDKMVVDQETNLEVRQPLSQEEIERIETLVKDSIGFDEERGDSVTVKSAEFVDTLMAAAVPWYEKSWFEEVSRQITTILILSIVALGVMRPLLSRILVPVGAVPPGMAASVGDEDLDIDTVEVGEGESLEDIKAKLKPKKAAVSAEMLDTANTYDDKVAVIRMIVSDEAGRVSNVFKNMMREDMDNL